MGGCEKIINHINADCDKRIAEINADTEKKCAEIMAEAQKQAQQITLEISKKSDAKVMQIKAASKSRAELETRNALLKKRREEIDITFNAILKYMTELADNEYFELIYKFAKKLDGKEGVLMLNAKDLGRLPSDFTQKLEQSGVKAELCNTPADISGGFILKCGDIEENMDFTAILADKRDLVEDIINSELFTA